MMELQFNCPTNLEQMPKVNGKVYCVDCEKTLIDFRNKSPEEIKQTLQKNTCGIYRPSQIENVQQSKIISRFRLAFAAIFIFGFSSQQLFAQDSTTVQQKPNITVSAFQYQLHGTVTDSEGEPVLFARVTLKIDSTVFNTATDFDGKYTITIPANIAANKHGEVLVKYIGYQSSKTIHIPFSTKQVVQVNVALATRDLDIVGVVVRTPFRINRAPYDMGKTVISGEDLRRMP
jgi:hypothetical protein